MNIPWEQDAGQKFNQMLAKVPVFLRPMATKKVTEKLEEISRRETRDQLTEKDLVDAFFAATPFGFHGPMKSDMEELGIDYRKYGYQR